MEFLASKLKSAVEREHYIYDLSHFSARTGDLMIGEKAKLLQKIRFADKTLIPPTIVVTSKACACYMDTGTLPKGFDSELRTAISYLERSTGCKFYSEEFYSEEVSVFRPLLLAVRPSPDVMGIPFLTQTVLGVGLTHHAIAWFQDTTDVYHGHAIDLLHDFNQTYGTNVKV